MALPQPQCSARGVQFPANHDVAALSQRASLGASSSAVSKREKRGRQHKSRIGCSYRRHLLLVPSCQVLLRV